MHQVEISTVEAFVSSRLGLLPVSNLDWLCLTGHSVLEAVGGPVFHDSTVAFYHWKSVLSAYPPELEVFNLASAWQKLAQALAYVGRTAQTCQELQSRMLAGKLVTVLMRVAFLLERRWIPYPKWTEKVFQALPCAAELTPQLARGVTASTWQEREDGLCAAAEILAARQADRGLPAISPATVPFFGRPYRTLDGRMPALLATTLTDPGLKALPLIGSVELWVDNADILATPEARPAVLETYQALIRQGGGVS